MTISAADYFPGSLAIERKRFDEANNLKWAKKMKAAGIKIIYSIPTLKVHAKMALLKRKEKGSTLYLGLLAAGNLNESTARFYTDHILLTSNQGLLDDMTLLFNFSKQTGKAFSKGKQHQLYSFAGSTV